MSDHPPRASRTRRIWLLALLASSTLPPSGRAEIPIDSEIQAVLALLPAGERAEATIVSVSEGRRKIVREGTNHQICELDKPGDTRFAVSCYHQDLENYFLRSLELARSGLDVDAARARMASELESGSLTIPSGGYQIYVSGERPSPDTLPASVTVYHLVYLPMTESTQVGLPDWDRGTEPWLHNAGTIDSHVMWSRERPLEH